MRHVLLAALLSLVTMPLRPLAAQRPAVAAVAAARAVRVVRVVVASAPYQAPLSARGGWALRDAWGRVHASGDGAPGWRIERRNRRLRAVSPDGARATAWSDEPFTLSASDESALLTWEKRRYRGVFQFVATDTAILVVNRLELEAYLRGVVPLELGSRLPNDSAAVQAQAIAARSYAVVRRQEALARAFDLSAAASDQVYGGVDAETAVADAAIAATAGLVLVSAGRVVRAPYHSTCGGQTAAPSEVWRGARDEAYLRGVSDRIPGSDRAWCDISPRFRWERTLDRAALDEAVARYVQAQPGAAALAGGGVRGARVEQSTPSGRVSVLTLDTGAGALSIARNDIRYVLRGASGEIVYSTYFSLEPVVGRDGRLMQLTLHGRGNGHGVGMCQWGAIGRARAGHDVRTILAAYYPGTHLTLLP
ncbi:MAG: SpoIID/LytB domain-containing protein [Gemmatimonadaceae bacterium]